LVFFLFLFGIVRIGILFFRLPAIMGFAPVRKKLFLISISEKQWTMCAKFDTLE